MAMSHEIDPKDVIWDALGDLSTVEVAQNQMLLAVYERPSKTKSGIYLADTTRDEDKFQGKVGLVVKLGPTAFVDTDKWTFDIKPTLGDWVVIRASDGFALSVNTKLCRLANDVDLKLRIQQPDQVW